MCRATNRNMELLTEFAESPRSITINIELLTEFFRLTTGRRL